ncbi:secretoglobin family 3A member 2-like [Molossus nigricans]
MKLVTVFLLVAIGLCSYSTTAFFIDSFKAFKKNLIPGSADSLRSQDPLKDFFQTTGVSVELILEELRKCVNELTPQASEPMTKLMEALSRLK